MSDPRMVEFGHDPETMARHLLGQRLVRVMDGQRLSGRIVEVEAYLGAKDRAAHTFGGRRTARNESMYLPGGHAYVYFIYGMHHCMNVVCGEADEGVAVLIRAIEPEEGVERMQAHRPTAKRAAALCSGPANLTRALAIDRSLDGENLRISSRLWIEHVHEGPIAARSFVRCSRVGVAYAGPWAEKPLRFVLRDSEAVSRPWPARLWKSRPKGR